VSNYLTRHRTDHGPRWALNGHYLREGNSLSSLLGGSTEAMLSALSAAADGPTADGELLAPIDEGQEVWAAGVTY